MRRIKKSILICCCISILFMGGCWDRVDIEDIGLACGVGVDYQESSAKHITPEFTIQTVVPKVLAGENGGGGSQAEPFQNLTIDESSLFEAGREASTATSRSPNYSHLKVLVISKEAAQSINLLQLLNFFFRDHEIRRTVHVLISEERASEILSIKGTKDPVPALKLLSITENMKTKTAKMPPKLSLGDFSEKMSASSSFLVQKVQKFKGGVQIIGAAVIKGNTQKMIGELNEDETFGINCITGEAKAGAVTGVDKETDKIITYEIDQLKSSIRPKVNGEDISYTVNINTEGRLSEDWIPNSDAFNEKFIRDAEKTIEKEFMRLMEAGLTKTQKELKVDVAGFGESLRINQPKVWKKVKGNWEERFPEASININVKVNIKQFQTQGRKMNKSK
ncbi:Ger(x)C family spore germination protein [Cytobacillus firmus]|uniref:Ger(x)C family spore germination protein n=1 Tax=Cytobacillus firmus TaxID=1399 RepID=UPI001CFDACF4|nr:Ger(x)C family spore germination protein [Cytobacillus firmus]URT70330.1 Ger(x)C family spore germination protein [Cytobacillus firmus]WHY61239.1 Ger(x)C family spore germination protein [Cytobacillus firmus]